MKLLLLCALLAYALPANAASVEERAEAVRAQTQGSDNYHAYLARELASVAEAEKGQHDITVARSFIEMAEKHAAMSGGAK